MSHQDTSDSKTEPQRILWVGCGGLGKAASPVLFAQGHQVTAAQRSAVDLPSDMAQLTVDVTQLESLSPLALGNWDIVIITLTAPPGASSYQAIYVDGLKNVLSVIQSRGRQPLVLFASSTSVYAHNDGCWVDELSHTQPTGYSGLTMLAAEAILAAANLPSCAIRFSGIYGPQRHNHLLQVLEQGRICPVRPEKYSNRIHVDDCVAVLVHLIDRYARGEPLESVYLASDGHPAPLREVMEWLAEDRGIALSGLIDDYRPTRGGNKRCHATRLCNEGFTLLFADFRQGLAS